MAYSVWIVIFFFVAVSGSEQSDTACSDTESLLQTTVRDSVTEQSAAQTVQEAQAAQLNEARKVEQSLHSLVATAEQVKAARASTSAAVGYETQAAEDLKLAYAEAQQAENIQEARAYQEANVTEILHEAVQKLEYGAAGHESFDLLEDLRKAESAQATIIKDAAQQDQALAGLRSTMASAVQAATTAKLVDETQTARTLDDAVVKLQAVQGAQLQHAKQSLALASTIGETAKSQQNEAQDKLRMAEARSKQLETELIQAQTLRANDKAALINAQKEMSARADAAAEHQKAEVARQQAAAMYQAASSTQAALEKQAGKTARSLLKVSMEASNAAKLLQDSISSDSSRLGS